MSSLLMGYFALAGTVIAGCIGARILGRFGYLYMRCNPDRTHTLSPEDKEKQQAIVSQIWENVDNAMYDTHAEDWWDPTKPFSSGLHAMTRLRAPYFISAASKSLSWTEKQRKEQLLTIVDVGCGGGVLSEGLIRSAVKEHGFRRVKLQGIDLAAGAIRVAEKHAKALPKELNEGSEIILDYKVGDACSLTDVVEDSSADIVVVADVLEHVLDVPNVIENVSRILKPGGIFVFDTIDRSLFSYVVAIFLAQELPFGLSILPSHTHEWGLFVKPKELESLCTANRMQLKEIRGFRPQIDMALVKGICKRSQFHKANFTLTNNTNAQYIGFAIKKGE